jgi:dihydroorotase
MLITNARWLTPEGDFKSGSIRIINGRYEQLSETQLKSDREEPIDAAGKLILPGAIDPHVHFREPGQLYKEGILNGSMAALKGGVTTVLDMPNNRPPCSTAARLQQKRQLFREKSLVNWGVMLHTSARNLQRRDIRPVAAKIYMAKSSPLAAITSVAQLSELFRAYPSLAIHAEDETAFPGNASARHHEKRPREAVTRALMKIGQALQAVRPEKQPRIVICHINTADEVAWLKQMRNDGFDVWGETCPHYLFFTQQDYLEKGAAFVVNPPIRSEEHRRALLEAVQQGVIDFIGTDHAPHSIHEKNSAKPPSGIAAVEWLAPLMLYLAGQHALPWKRLHELICGKAAACYRMKDRDGIITGNYADLVILRKSTDATNDSRIQTKAGVNLYDHLDLPWQVDMTMVNGIVAYDGKQFFSKIKGKEVEIGSYY